MGASTKNKKISLRNKKHIRSVGNCYIHNKSVDLYAYDADNYLLVAYYNRNEVARKLVNKQFYNDEIECDSSTNDANMTLRAYGYCVPAYFEDEF